MNAVHMTTLANLAGRLDAVLVGVDAPFDRVVTDSRALQPRDLFVALIGERFDGHSFVARAHAAGAAGALVTRQVAEAGSQVVAADTLVGLQQFAASWRNGFDLPLVGVTGSAGKTTTRQMVAAVLAELGPVLATQGNLNNHIGVPLTLCRLRGEHRAAVIEMGANHAGEIALLASLARPDIGIVTLAGDAHLEGFGSRQGVAHAKGEMFTALNRHGTAIINFDDAYASLWRDLAGDATILGFGLDNPADASARDIVLGDQESRFTLVVEGHGKADVHLHLPGRHNVRNALAAAAAGVAAKLPVARIAARLGEVRPVNGRGVWNIGYAGARVLDDSYNANPTSMRAGVQVLMQRPGKHVAVLGDMGELGANAEALHEQLGRDARSAGVDVLYAAGSLSRATVRGFGPQGCHFETLEELVEALKPALDGETSVLVKGSHSAHMERVVQALQVANGGHD